MPWKAPAVELLRDLIHWASQWIIFCPFLTVASSRSSDDQDKAQNRFLAKFLFSLMIQIATGVASVAVGSYITLQIVTYQIRALEDAKVDHEKRIRDLTERQGRGESDVAVIKERHRLEELMRGANQK